jgi:5'-deoxynucleotidase YfbR-like HD superfamily hydrolase
MMTALAKSANLEHVTDGVFTSTSGESWLQTGSGRRVPVLNPQADDIDIIDIINSISKLCRFNGHCSEFYSVAQHCVLGADFILAEWDDVELAKEFLLHDATESYVGDMIRPVKIHVRQFLDIEDRFTTAISTKFDLPLEMTSRCKEVDNIMVTWEKRDLLPNSEEWPRLPDISVYNLERIEPLSWRAARMDYIVKFEELFNCRLDVY